MSAQGKDSSIKVALEEVKLEAADVTVFHKPNAVLLEGFPLLVYAPLQESHGHPDFSKPHDPMVHGNMIRVENNGTPVADIVKELAVNPDAKAVAKKFGTTEEHVRQAHDYAVAHVTPAPAHDAPKAT